MTRWLLTAAFATALCSPFTRADGPASVTVTVPVGASLTVNGQRTEQMTAVRHFVSPPLPEGQAFEYTFRASFTVDGVVVNRTKTVPVAANVAVDVDMTAAPAEAAPPVKPPAPPEPTPAPKFDPPAKKPDPTPEPKPEPKKPDPTPPPPPKIEPPPVPEPRKDPPKKVEPKTPTVPPPPPPEAKKPIVVPYVSTPDDVVKQMLKSAAVKPGDIVYDLGCGDGRIVIAAVKDFQAKRGLGIDLDPARVADSNAAAKKAGVDAKLTFKQGDVLSLTAEDFANVDVVTLYLLPELNRKLKPILKKGLKPGARVVSHDFAMGDDWKEDSSTVVTDPDGTEHTVFVWTIKPK